ncbi:hypothetical protein LOZ58_006862 [Ophidiomyces ophidiicola]|nr:hypothetical protein LOZ65_006910 [Ophidiomyces ophidiicola]KAI1932498.1 hypothetical protein LOZ66_006858 [Ophidiomyces ophidiicola]KAI1955087.1 hypothetical protein LOZ58_006862 [Ophidiomyces ophidiicola]
MEVGGRQIDALKLLICFETLENALADENPMLSGRLTEQLGNHLEDPKAVAMAIGRTPSEEIDDVSH